MVRGSEAIFADRDVRAVKRRVASDEKEIRIARKDEWPKVDGEFARKPFE
jgi:hypothetical protein